MSAAMNGKIHDFKSEHAWAEAQTGAPYWEQLYHQWFPDFLSRQPIPPGGVGQRHGRDTVVVLTNGEQLCVQEKIRRLRDTGDILLEYEHRFRSGYVKPGWVNADEHYDFLAYVFVPSQVGYLLPFQPLRAAWLGHREEWLKLGGGDRQGFRLCPAQNRDYVTWSVAVPTKTLYRAVGSALRVTWEDGAVASGGEPPGTSHVGEYGAYRMEPLV